VKTKIIKAKICYLLLATIPLLLSPICQLIHNYFQITTHEGSLGMGGIGIALISLFNYMFIGVVCGFGVWLFCWLHNREVTFNPLKLLVQWDGIAKNVIRVLGYTQIFFSIMKIQSSLPESYTKWYWPYALMCGIFGLVGAILYMLVFCSAKPVSMAPKS